MAIFKNEADIMAEWLGHHINQGVDHFYLIDNGSTDTTAYQQAMAPYREVIDLVVDSQRYQQPEHYNKYFLKKVKSETEWVMVIDLDEFVYANANRTANFSPKTPQFQTITDYLVSAEVPTNIGQIYLPWKEYGSNGHLQIPSGLLKENFIRRKLYKSPTITHTKTIVRSRDLLRMWIHHSFLKNDFPLEITSDGRPRPKDTLPYMAPISEEILAQSALHCNHYYARSFEWYRQVKMKRGSASAQSDERDLSLDRFNQWNHATNQVIDRGNYSSP